MNLRKHKNIFQTLSFNIHQRTKFYASKTCLRFNANTGCFENQAIACRSIHLDLYS